LESDLALLATLDALLQEESVSRAARRVGLSTPAMSHALARIRERLGDPVLVRSGRAMVLTPRAQAMKARVHAVVTEAKQTLESERPFVARELARTFVVRASDYVATVLGPAIDRVLAKAAPLVTLRFVPNSPEDPAKLRDSADLAVGIYGDLPAEMRQRQLLTDRFVCVVRRAHPTVREKISLDQFVSLPHVQVAPRGTPGGYIDDVLRDAGRARRVQHAVPFFLAALHLTSKTDYVLTVPERLATRMAPCLDLRVLEVPLSLRPYALSLVWHPRFDADAAHRFVREAFVSAARDAASELHTGARTRLDLTDPASGQSRKRPRRRA
jgi:DNA-binding transcriptional LysR family regulator